MKSLKNTNWKVLKAAIGFSIAASSIAGNVHADVGLPYIGIKASSCKVKGIDTVLDGGYLTDEKCNTLFVRPPKFGEARLSAYSSTTNLSKCDRINASNAAQLGNILMVKDYSNQQLKLNDELRKALAEGSSEAVERIKEKLRNVNELLTLFNSSVVSQDEAIEDANSRYGGPVMITLMYHWAKVVDLYREANPQFKAVKPLPITKGYLTHKMSNASAGAMSLGENPVIDIHSTGLPIAQSSSSDSDSEDLLSASQDTSNSTAALMEGTANLGLELSLLGLCPYKNMKSSELFNGTVTESPVAYLTPNFTYFYPVASKSIYKVSINPVSLGEAVIALRKKGQGLVQSMDLANVLSENEGQIFEEVSTSDIGGSDGVSEETKKQAKQHLLDYIANSVLRNIGTLVDTLSNSSSHRIYWKETVHATRSCGFLGWDRCRYSYKVTKSKPNWAKIAKEIEKQLNTTRTASSESQNTYQIAGTMAFVPPEEIPKLEKEYQNLFKEEEEKK